MAKKKKKEDRIVYSDLEGYTSVDLDKWLDSQPVDGILYDLNRLPEWVNDFAVQMVIKRLHERCIAKDARIEELEKEISREEFTPNEEEAA